MPTILEATGIQAPDMVNGIKQKPIEGVSMAYTFDKANANAPSKHNTQYFEMFANRGIYHDGWYACTTPPVPPWLLGTSRCRQLTTTSGSSTTSPRTTRRYNDLAAKNPDKLKELQASFMTEAGKYQVFHWTTRFCLALLTPRPSAIAGRTCSPTRARMPGIPVGNAPSILNKSTLSPPR